MIHSPIPKGFTGVLTMSLLHLRISKVTQVLNNCLFGPVFCGWEAGRLEGLSLQQFWIRHLFIRRDYPYRVPPEEKFPPRMQTPTIVWQARMVCCSSLARSIQQSANSSCVGVTLVPEFKQSTSTVVSSAMFSQVIVYLREGMFFLFAFRQQDWVCRNMGNSQSNEHWQF